MKKYSLIFIIILFLLTTTSCVVLVDNNITLPKTIDEVEQMISAVPNCYYELDDVVNTEYVEEAPVGAQITLIAEASNDFFIGVRFVDEDSLKNTYNEIVLLIEDLIVYEFNKDKKLFKIYSNDCWIYTGSSDFVSYFEGKNDEFINQEEIIIPLETIEDRLKNYNFEVNMIDIPVDSKLYKEMGVQKVVLASNTTSSEVITLYQLTTRDNCIRYRDELIDSLEEDYFLELVDELNLDIHHYKYSTYENYVYVGTEKTVAIIKGEYLNIGN